ncbi:MAG: hypothetical protein QM773_13790 [Hyphomonadaceae bacterium]
MAETEAERRKRLEGPPPKTSTMLGEGVIDTAVLDHAAFSLWRLANALERNNELLDRLGFNGPGDQPGAVEMLGIQLKNVTEAINAHE